jgi:hypothetical protein
MSREQEGELRSNTTLSPEPGTFPPLQLVGRLHLPAVCQVLVMENEFPHIITKTSMLDNKAIRTLLFSKAFNVFMQTSSF